MKKIALPIRTFLCGAAIGGAAWLLSFTPAHARLAMPAIQPDTFLVKGTVQAVNDYTKTVEGLPATTIMIKGTNIGVISGGNGDFQLRYVPGRDTITLVFSAMTFYNKEITITNLHAENGMDLGNVMMNPRPAGSDVPCPPVKGIKRHKNKH